MSTLLWEQAEAEQAADSITIKPFDNSFRQRMKHHPLPYSAM